MLKPYDDDRRVMLYLSAGTVMVNKLISSARPITYITIGSIGSVLNDNRREEIFIRRTKKELLEN
jgi:hypothetical protein